MRSFRLATVAANLATINTLYVHEAIFLVTRNTFVFLEIFAAEIPSSKGKDKPFKEQGCPYYIPEGF